MMGHHHFPPTAQLRGERWSREALAAVTSACSYWAQQPWAVARARKSQIKTSNTKNVSHTEKQQEPSQTEVAIPSPTGQAWRQSTVFSCRLQSSHTGTRSNRRGRSNWRLKNPRRPFRLVHGCTNTLAAGTSTSLSSREKQESEESLSGVVSKMTFYLLERIFHLPKQSTAL